MRQALATILGCLAVVAVGGCAHMLKGYEYQIHLLGGQEGDVGPSHGNDLVDRSAVGEAIRRVALDYRFWEQKVGLTEAERGPIVSYRKRHVDCAKRHRWVSGWRATVGIFYDPRSLTITISTDEGETEYVHSLLDALCREIGGVVDLSRMDIDVETYARSWLKM